MQYYLAPLEDLTSYIFRNVYHKYYEPADKYFTPFIAPGQFFQFGDRDWNEVCPENNVGKFVVPQLLTNVAEDYLRTENMIAELGYEEINLNFGCPSKRVVSRQRGSGFLAFPDKIHAFLDEVFAKNQLRISIKTRLGRYSSEEFVKLLDIYNEYPLEELIIHARVREQFYSGEPDLEMYSYASRNSKNPVCYNGDIYRVEDQERLLAMCPETTRIMAGRGILRDPDLFGKLKGMDAKGYDVFLAFLDELLEAYILVSPNRDKALVRLKEVWSYLKHTVPGGKELFYKIVHCNTIEEYRTLLQMHFQDLS